MYCTHCFGNLFKDDPRTSQIRTKTKETKWVNEILSHLPGLNWVWDKPIYVDFVGGCCSTKRRIDLRLLVEHPQKGLFWLCIEIDENQHKPYAAGYEEGRYNDLFTDFSGRYVFLRVNPDAFRQNGKRVNPPFEERVQEVMGRIRYYLDEGPTSEDLVQVDHFYYDAQSVPPPL
jgi:hypothetical protein